MTEEREPDVYCMMVWPKEDKWIGYAAYDDGDGALAVEVARGHVLQAVQNPMDKREMMSVTSGVLAELTYTGENPKMQAAMALLLSELMSRKWLFMHLERGKDVSLCLHVRTGNFANVKEATAWFESHEIVLGIRSRLMRKALGLPVAESN